MRFSDMQRNNPETRAVLIRNLLSSAALWLSLARIVGSSVAVTTTGFVLIMRDGYCRSTTFCATELPPLPL